MTHAQRADWIRRGFLLFLAIGVGTGAWLSPKKPKPAHVAPLEKAEVKGEEKAGDDAGEKAANAYDLEIYLYEAPGEAESEEMAVILDAVGDKYEKYVRVHRVDVTQHPELAKEQKVTRPPKVVMMAGETRACKFQGTWTQAQVERKVEEILRGLKRMNKDWRPNVKGMSPDSGQETLFLKPQAP